jgi:putative (di)nucleoside polyphosphate hydrolase
MVRITGFVRKGKFECIPAEQGVLDEIRLTTMTPQNAISPEAAEIDLKDLEGRLIRVEGEMQGEWLYSARLLTAQHFRANVGVVLINRHGEVLAAERRAKGSGEWQMVQGGINEMEEPRQAAERELMEEIGLGTQHAQFLDEYPDWLAYEIPAEARKAKLGRGQVQKWFLVRFTGKDEDIDLFKYARQQGKKPEFGAWKWVPLQQLARETWEVRRSTYEKLASYFRDYLTE